MAGMICMAGLSWPWWWLILAGWRPCAIRMMGAGSFGTPIPGGLPGTAGDGGGGPYDALAAPFNAGSFGLAPVRMFGVPVLAGALEACWARIPVRMQLTHPGDWGNLELACRLQQPCIPGNRSAGYWLLPERSCVGALKAVCEFPLALPQPL